MTIAAALQSTEFVALTLYKCADGYQANLQSEPGAGWRCITAASPVEALEELLGVPLPGAPRFLQAVPPCPVPLVIPPPPC